MTRYHPKNKFRKFMKKPMFLVIDLEANCSTKDSRDWELIEFPCILVRNDGTIISKFCEFVKMISHEFISEFIQNLCHISDDDLLNGCHWNQCLMRFENWLKSHNVTSQNTTIVSCGDWDFNTMLPQQLFITRTCLSPYLTELFACWNNMKMTYVKCVNTSNYDKRKRLPDMPNMLNMLGMSLDGHHHRGIDDCSNIVKICIWLNIHGSDVTCANRFKKNNYWYES